MYIKRYTVAAFVLMGLLGAYVFSYVTQESLAINFFGIPLPALSIAVWVIVPVGLLYIASVLHMSFYSFLGSFKLRKFEKDYEKIIDAIVEAYLGKKVRHHTFKTERYKLMGTLFENSVLFPMTNETELTGNEKIDGVLKIIEDVKAGRIVELKSYNLLKENELVVQNERNKYKKGDLTAEALLSNSEKYAEVLRQEAYIEYVKSATFANIDKYKTLLTKESLYSIISRVNADKNSLDMSIEELLSLVKTLEFTKDDFIKLSSNIAKSGMIPEQRMYFFEMLSNENEDAIDAYLYTLFDLEMLNPVDEILDNAHESEYQNFKAYRALKECNKNFSIELFV